MVRNARMLAQGKPNAVLAFHDNIGTSRGTKNMVDRAIKAGLPVTLWTHEGSILLSPYQANWTRDVAQARRFEAKGENMSASFGCPRCGSNRSYEINSTYVSYEVLAWNEDGGPEKSGEPEYGDHQRRSTATSAATACWPIPTDAPSTIRRVCRWRCNVARSAVFGCPHCGSAEIEEVNEEIAYHPILEWSKNGEVLRRGEPTYGNSYRADIPYVCASWGHDFEEPSRLPLRVDRG